MHSSTSRFAVSTVALCLAICGCDDGTGNPSESAGPLEDRTEPTPATTPPLSGWGAPLAVSALPALPLSITSKGGVPHEYPEHVKPAQVAPLPWLAGRSLALRDAHLYIADVENGELAVLDRFSGLVLTRIPVGAHPEHVVVGPNGTIFVSVRGDGAIVRVNGETWETHAVNVGTEPLGLALSADGTALLVTDHSEGVVRHLDATSLETVSTLEGFDRPRTVALRRDGFGLVGDQRTATRIRLTPTLDGSLALSLQSLPHDVVLPREQPWDSLLHPAEDRAATATANRVLSAVEHPDGDRMLYGFVQSLAAPPADEEPNPRERNPQPVFGYGVSLPTAFPDMLRSIEASVGAVAPESPADGSARPQPAFPVRHPISGHVLAHLVSQPRDMNHHPTHQLVFVVGFTTDTVLVLATHVDTPLRSAVGVLRTGRAPTGIVFAPDGQTAYVLNRIDYTVTEYALDALLDPPFDSPRNPSTWIEPPSWSDDVAAPVELLPNRQATVGTDPRPEDVRLGHRLFTFANNPDISQHGEHACESCHIDQGEDGQVWHVFEGLRQTPVLAGRLQGTAPFNWSGSEAGLRNNMNNTIGRMLGLGLSDEHLTYLEAFLLSTQALPNPSDAAPLSAAAVRGEVLFNDPVVACAKCHSGPHTTDGLMHDVGTVTERELLASPGATGSLNTPSLRSVYATPPYLHDGSAATLMDVLEATGHTMGETHHLSESEKLDLVAYLRTL